MADNTELNKGSGGDKARTIDKGGAKTQTIVIDKGGVGIESLVTDANPFPIAGALTDAELRDAPLDINPLSDYLIEATVGGAPGSETRDEVGYISDLGTSIKADDPSSWVDIWPYEGRRTSPTSTFAPYMASDDPLDTGIEITWIYLDENGDEHNITVLTDAADGTVPVSLGITATEVYRGYNDSDSLFIGTIALATANNFTDGVPDEQDQALASIEAINQQSQVLAFRVPLGKLAVITNVSLYLSRTSGSDGAAEISIDIRETGKLWRTIRSYPLTNSSSIKDPDLIRLPELTDVRARIRDVSDNQTTISGRIGYVLID